MNANWVKILEIVCVASMAISSLILNGKFIFTGNKDGYYPLTPKKIALQPSPMLFLSPLFVLMVIHKDDFKNKEVAGKIMLIKEDPRTSFLVGADSEDVPLGYQAKGLAVGDSFYKPKFQDLEFHFFKIDSSGHYREIEFYPIDNAGTNMWRFKQGKK